MFTQAYLEPSRRSTMELFLLRLSHILKTYLIRSNWLSVPYFLHNSPFSEKTYNCENFARKSLLLTMEQNFFFRNLKLRDGMASSPKMNKEGFLNSIC